MSLDPVDLKNDLDFQQTYRNLGSLQGRATVRDPESRSFILSLSLSLSQRESSNCICGKSTIITSIDSICRLTYNFETETFE